MPRTVTRRVAMKTAAVGLAAGSAGCAMTEKTGGPGDAAHATGWIDAHVHVWTDDIAAYPLADGFTKENMKPPTFPPEELFAHCEPSGVRRINLIQMSYYRFDNSYMLDVMARYPGQFAGTGMVDVAAKDVADQMRRLNRRGVRAFRIYPGLARRKPADWLRLEGYDAMFKAGAKYNQAMSCLIDIDALPELDRMCGRHPDTPVIIDHLCRIRVGESGEADPAQVDALCRMSRHRRVMVKVGAFYALSSQKGTYEDLLPLIRRVVEAFGADRCMWESDAPFEVTQGDYAASVALIRDRCDFLTASDKEQVLRTTAEQFFFS